MKIKVNYAVSAFFFGSIILLAGVALFFAGGQLSETAEEMFGENGALTIWGGVLVAVGIVLNMFASRKA